MTLTIFVPRGPYHSSTQMPASQHEGTNLSVSPLPISPLLKQQFDKISLFTTLHPLPPDDLRRQLPLRATSASRPLPSSSLFVYIHGSFPHLRHTSNAQVAPKIAVVHQHTLERTNITSVVPKVHQYERTRIQHFSRSLGGVACTHIKPQ